VKTARKKHSKGSALIEAALVMPVLVALMVNAMNFGTYVYTWITIDNAARAVLQYRAYSGVVLGFPAAPVSSQLQNLVTAEVAALPNKTSVTWEICSTPANTPCIGNGTTFSPPADNGGYKLYAVDIGYTFIPFLSGITVPLPTAIHRQAFMRSME
jgi:TadE-like protein